MATGPRLAAKPLLPALNYAEPRPTPTAEQGVKRKYAERLSHGIAQVLADALRPDFPEVLPDEHGGQHESRVRIAKGFAKLDVNFSTPQMGIGFGITVKTVGVPDPRTGDYTHNYKRINEELISEAVRIHERQPYAVMFGVLFLPFDACTDGKGEKGVSSFARGVKYFRPRSGRKTHEDRPDLLESMFIAAYHLAPAEQRGEVAFFDVSRDPYRNRPPAPMLSFPEFLKSLGDAFTKRNTQEFEFAE